MNTSHLKRLAIGVIAVIVLIITFISGAYIGSQTELRAFQSDSIINKENPVASNIDFSPFWKVWSILDAKYVSTKKPLPDEQQKVWGAIQGLASSLGDPYTVFFPPVQSKMFASDIAGNFEGVGMEVALKDNILTVVAPLKGSPAAKAGIMSGDKILKINGTTTADMSVDAAVQLIRGKGGTTVTLNVFRDSKKEPFDVTITRAVIDIPTIDTELRPDGIFVIKLYSFSANSASLFRDALRTFYNSHSDKLIIDLRGNPGGYLDAAVDMASWFLPSGKVVVTEDFGKNGNNQVYRSKGYNAFPNAHIVVLIDGGSASASEILSGALQEQGVAKLVGVKSFGKGSVQELIPITDDTSLKVTVARWLTPKGNSISEGGLTPDYVVKMTPDDVDKKHDPQMDKAAQLLNGY